MKSKLTKFDCKPINSKQTKRTTMQFVLPFSIAVKPISKAFLLLFGIEYGKHSIYRDSNEASNGFG